MTAERAEIMLTGKLTLRVILSHCKFSSPCLDCYDADADL